ncbi:hypothetical protein HYW17_01600 [Candidatus Uhrbacteria bacterium]|nr:hypothetical protein [Candidatus Uhrbacteria bacterium]
MQNQYAVARIGRVSVLFIMLFGAENISCGGEEGPAGLSSNPQDWPVPPRCDSRVCEVEALIDNMCVEVEGVEDTELVGMSCNINSDSCEDGVYVCQMLDCTPFIEECCDNCPEWERWKVGCEPRCAEEEDKQTQKLLNDQAAEQFCGCLEEEGLLGEYQLSCTGLCPRFNGGIPYGEPLYELENEAHCIWEMAIHGMLHYLTVDSSCLDSGIGPNSNGGECVINAKTCDEVIACLSPEQNPHDYCANICGNAQDRCMNECCSAQE